MINMTEKAIGEVRRLMDQQNIPDLVLRLGVEGGGCSGMSYTMNFDTQVADDDEIIDTDGVRIVVDGKSMLYLNDLTVDFVQNMMGSGFRFSNPNASKSCGCGSSFSV